MKSLLVKLLETLADHRQKVGAAIGQQDRAVQALKQPCIEKFLELPDLLAISSRTVPEPKQLTHSANPPTSPRQGLTTCVA